MKLIKPSVGAEIILYIFLLHYILKYLYLTTENSH